MRIVPQPMRKQVEAGLRDAIVIGHFAPGDHLSDRHLCELFGVSRTIIREAVRRLEAEGLIAVHPHRGAFVALMTAAEARQIYEVRVALEGLAGGGFAMHATAAERVLLRETLEGLRSQGRGIARAEPLQAKMRFYAALLRGCGNPHVEALLGQLLNRSTQLRAMSLSAPDRFDAMIAEIQAGVEATERRDAGAARWACEAHVAEAASVALRLLASAEAERLVS